MIFSGLEVLHHHAKFGVDQTMRAGCRCKNMVFVCFFSVCHAPVRNRTVRSSGTYFDQVLCHGLWADFYTVFTVFQN